MRTRRSAARGFTLVEMLVAVAIVAIAMGAIIAGMARYADNVGYLRQKTLAVWVAHNRLAELELQRSWPDVGKSDGNVDMAGAKWKWQAEVKATDDPHLRRVDLRVFRVDPKKTLDTAKQPPLAKLSAFLGDSGRK
ncbi:MAG: type II secretion system minor pseudopilin GspI [Solimonas sp.]